MRSCAWRTRQQADQRGSSGRLCLALAALLSPAFGAAQSFDAFDIRSRSPGPSSAPPAAIYRLDGPLSPPDSRDAGRIVEDLLASPALRAADHEPPEHVVVSRLGGGAAALEHMVLEPRFHGIPVFEGHTTFHLDAAGRLLRVNRGRLPQRRPRRSPRSPPPRPSTPPCARWASTLSPLAEVVSVSAGPPGDAVAPRRNRRSDPGRLGLVRHGDEPRLLAAVSGLAPDRAYQTLVDATGAHPVQLQLGARGRPRGQRLRRAADAAP